MSNALFMAIRLAVYSSSKNDIESFKFHSENARLIAKDISYDAYLATNLALDVCYQFFITHIYEQNDKKLSEYSDVHTWVRLNKDLNFKDGYKLQSGRIPDFISSENNIDYPVECKIKFTERGLNQLKTYMVEMGVDKGYAVAFSCEIELPNNITFIQVGEKNV
jgi:hypothetical protein